MTKEEMLKKRKKRMRRNQIFGIIAILMMLIPGALSFWINVQNYEKPTGIIPDKSMETLIQKQEKIREEKEKK